MPSNESTWAVRAARRVEARFAALPHRWSPMDHGILLPARTDSRERPLSAAFRVEVMQALGTQRRVAVAAGTGRPLMIFPGLYASLNEGLFALIAELAAQRGQAVALVEDRLAAPTLRLTSGDVPSFARIGAEIAALAKQIGPRPDALALSAGASAVLAAPPGTFARIATWSGAVDIWAVAENLARHPMPRWHYSQVHRKAFHGAALPVPPIATIPARLAAGAPCGVPPGPLLVLHAEDDPVVPVASVRAYPIEDEQHLAVLPAGAHLGFGTLAGPDVYLAPFDED